MLSWGRMIYPVVFLEQVDFTWSASELIRDHSTFPVGNTWLKPQNSHVNPGTMKCSNESFPVTSRAALPPSSSWRFSRTFKLPASFTGRVLGRCFLGGQSAVVCRQLNVNKGRWKLSEALEHSFNLHNNNRRLYVKNPPVTSRSDLVKKQKFLFRSLEYLILGRQAIKPLTNPVNSAYS